MSEQEFYDRIFHDLSRMPVSGAQYPWIPMILGVILLVMKYITKE